MDDRLRRCSIHGPELRAYVEALVKAEAERAVEKPSIPIQPRGMVKIHVRCMGEGRPLEYGDETVVTDDDGETD